MESSAQVTPSLSKLQTEPSETPEQLRVFKFVKTRSNLIKNKIKTMKPVKSRINSPHHSKLQLSQVLFLKKKT
jgi:hypothetical protein